MLLGFAALLYVLAFLVKIQSPMTGAPYVAVACCMLGVLFVGLDVVHKELRQIRKELISMNARKD